MLIETHLRIPFFVIGRNSRMPTSYWLQGKCARIKLSQAASYIFSVKIAALESLKRVTCRIFKISNLTNFKGASKNFEFNFFINKDTKNCKNYQLMNRKYLFIIMSLQKKIHLVT
jgi:hypothetical protein